MFPVVYTPVVRRVGVKLACEYLRGNLPEVFAANVAVVALHVRQAVALAAAPVTVEPAQRRHHEITLINQLLKIGN